MHRCTGAVRLPNTRPVDGVLLLPHQDHRVPQVRTTAFPGIHFLQYELSKYFLFNNKFFSRTQCLQHVPFVKWKWKVRIIIMHSLKVIIGFYRAKFCSLFYYMFVVNEMSHKLTAL